MFGLEIFFLQLKSSSEVLTKESTRTGFEPVRAEPIRLPLTYSVE